MAPGQQRRHRGLLAGTKIVKAEYILQDAPLRILSLSPCYLHRSVIAQAGPAGA
jgi:hypothetical protein